MLELGAGLGIVGAVVAARAEPERVLSFEANPALIRHIRRLHRINGLTRRIELRNEVLVGPEETRTTLPFHIRSSYLGSSLHSTGRAAETVNVVTAPLGEVMEELRPDVMLIDIEGGEREILKAADLSGVRALVVEFHPEVYGRDGMAELKKLLTEAGFQRDPEHSSRRVWTCRRPH